MVKLKSSTYVFLTLGGVAYQETSSGSGPYFLGEVNCKGNESHLFNCSIGVEECDSQYSLGSAGVLCYKRRSRSFGGLHMLVIFSRFSFATGTSVIRSWYFPYD